MGLRRLARRLRFPRRPRLQYGLRSLLIATLVVCLGLGWYVGRVRRQQRAVAALTADGATIFYYDGCDTSFFTADDFFEGEKVENPQTLAEWIEYYSPTRLRMALGTDFFRRVDRVDCSWNFDFPHDPDVLLHLPGLRELDLHFALDEDLAVVGALTDLTKLRMSHSIISDAGLAKLAKLRNLESLEISFEQHILMSISHQPITDAGLAHLASLRRLKVLDLSGSSIEGDGLRHLAGMTDLERLDLGETKLTDAALVHLARLPQLKWLDIHDTVVTPGLAEEMLPNTEVTRYNVSGSPALTPAQALVRAGRWKQALDALEDERASWVEAHRATANQQGDADPLNDRSARTERRLWLYNSGQCHAELGHWREAAKVFCDLLEDIHKAPPAMGGLSERKVWQQLYEWPDVFAGVAKARPNDCWHWITLAQRAVIEGRWADAAAYYARAMAFPETERFQYAVASLLIANPTGHERVCRELLNLDGLAVERLAQDPTLGDQVNLRGGWLDATHVWFLAPQGTVSALQIGAWRRDEDSSLWDELQLLPLVYLRAGEFQKVLEQHPLGSRWVSGRYWFCRAIAHQHLGSTAAGREDYRRGAQWLKRRMDDDRLRGVQQYVADTLESEVLRREAERLISERPD